MIVSIIVAASENNVIGKDNDLIWNLPDDTAYFKRMTKGHCVLTGRRNYESIPEKYRPLPHRTNIVVTRGDYEDEEGLYYVKNIEQGIALAAEQDESELFIIGGGEIYRQSLNLADNVYLTRVHGIFEGDTYFPELEMNIWKEVSREFHPADDKHKYSMSFLRFNKK
ncbi:MAG TPA: diacylglycerol kinase [Flavobacteriales bacterium]|nr:diacylglycerol kinase [Flavobacteriales bacterium]